MGAQTAAAPLADRAAPRRDPLPHQSDAIGAVVPPLPIGGRARLVMPCGAGKTLTALWIAEELRASQVLIFVPTLDLLAQTVGEWRRNMRQQRSMMAVCSDDAAGEERGTSTSAVSKVVPVTTLPDEVAAFLGEAHEAVLFACYQSGATVAAAHGLDLSLAFDLGVFDEAHRTVTGDKFGLFSTGLHDVNIRCARRLFATATQRILTPRQRATLEGDRVASVSMDDEEMFGPLGYELPLEEAIALGLLTDYQVVVAVCSHARWRELAETLERVHCEGREANAGVIAGGGALLDAMREYNLSRVVTFHNSVAAAEEFAADLPRIAKLVAPERGGLGALRAL